ncbi:MAG: two-component system alkaline phosphatase synthesis response regulator PhoP [Myxococcota bacterium]|jgi:two-component system alkaline phosphatase synthesis response regulator PhoP
MAKRILIVEDDPSILRALQMNLRLEGFEVVTATNGPDALAAVDAQTLDLVVLDIMLPHMNGFEVCRRLRRSGVDLPIILLSAKNAEEDIVMGLGLGADDYVTKPFRRAELLARVRAHLRRRSDPPTVYTFADVEVDLERQLVLRAGQHIELTQREFDLLALLVDREGKALTRDTILAGVWGRNYFGTDRTVDNFITRLRQKVDARPPRHILTVRGVGYRFVRDPT